MKKILSELASHLKVKGLRGLAKHLDVPESRIYSWTKKGKIANPGIIIAKHPEISEEWLRTGKGSMLVKRQEVMKKIAKNTIKNTMDAVACLDSTLPVKDNQFEIYSKFKEIINSSSEFKTLAESNIRLLHAMLENEAKHAFLINEFQKVLDEISSVKKIVLQLAENKEKK